jgi:DNA ligase-1
VKRFAQLLELLVLTPSRNRKIEALREYFATVPDPDRGFALAILRRGRRATRRARRRR